MAFRRIQNISNLNSVLYRASRSNKTCLRSLSVGALNYKAPALDNQKPLTKEGPEKIINQAVRNEDAGSLTELIRDFLDPREFYEAVRKHGVDFFCGVPDSLLKDFCAFVTTTVPEQNHVISANEGTAIALASGYHLSTGKTAMVYLQNSGLGNIVNPLMSLAVPSVYSIPMLLLVGWRGEPGKRDEPQHVVQGKATPGLLAACGIPFQVLPDYLEGAEQALYTARKHMEVTKGPYCLLVRRQTFLPFEMEKEEPLYPLNREEAIHVIGDCLHDRDVVVGTTGMLSRELFEYRVSRGHGHEKDFLTVGSMGHASAIALGIAMQRPRRQVFCLDGDGAAIMHLGNMATIGQHGSDNFKHIVINNGAHDSVGGQPTHAKQQDQFSITQVANGVGYRKVMSASDPQEISEAVKALRQMDGPALLEVKVNTGHRKNLGRPTRTPTQNKTDFMHYLAID